MVIHRRLTLLSKYVFQGNGVNKNKSQNGRPGGNRPGEKKVFHMSIQVRIGRRNKIVYFNFSLLINTLHCNDWYLFQENVTLHKTENAWKPAVKASNAENGDEANAMTDLAKKARGILNKLTPQRFDTLVDQFDKLEIDTEDKLKLCMELVFEKVLLIDRICS